MTKYVLEHFNKPKSSCFFLEVDGCSVLPNYCKAGTCVDNGKEGVSCQCPNGYKFNGCTLGCEGIVTHFRAGGVALGIA